MAGSSTDQNIQFAKTFQAGAQYAKPGDKDADGFVKFDHAAWQAWDKAIQNFIDDIDDKINPKLPELSKISDGVGTLLSATDTRTLLNETAPEDIKQAVKKYRDYLVELQKGIKAAYEALNKVDSG
jgi:oligoendopeptidase F